MLRVFLFDRHHRAELLNGRTFVRPPAHHPSSVKPETSIKPERGECYETSYSLERCSAASAGLTRIGFVTDPNEAR